MSPQELDEFQEAIRQPGGVVMFKRSATDEIRSLAEGHGGDWVEWPMIPSRNILLRFGDGRTGELINGVGQNKENAFCRNENGHAIAQEEPPELLTAAGYASVFEELDRFRMLRENWDGEGSNAIHERTVQNGRRLIAYVVGRLPVPLVDANPNGTIACEWHSSHGMAYLEVGRTTFAVFVECRGEMVFRASNPMDQSDACFRCLFDTMARYLNCD